MTESEIGHAMVSPVEATRLCCREVEFVDQHIRHFRRDSCQHTNPFTSVEMEHQLLSGLNTTPRQFCSAHTISTAQMKRFTG